MKQDEERAYNEAQTANENANNYREDLSFLTKEQTRLTNELQYERDQKVKLQDQLQKIEHDHNEVLNSGYMKDEALKRELESLRSLREIN